MPSGKVLAVGALAALLSTLTVTTGAGAALVKQDTAVPFGTSLVVRDASDADVNSPAETNVMTIGWDAAAQEIVIRDTGAPLTVGPGSCSLVSAAEVRCPKPSAAVAIYPGAGSDEVTFLPGLPALGDVSFRYPWIVRSLVTFAGTQTADVDRYHGGDEANWFSGGDGADVLEGGGGDDMLDTSSNVGTLRGGDGDDVLAVLNHSLSGSMVIDGGADEDTITGTGQLIGGEGDDTLYPRQGSGDVIDGGTGHDGVNYRAHSAGVTIDLAAGPSFPQGKPGESDSIVGVEDASGSTFGDRLYGTASRNYLVGGTGADELYGRDGDDDLDGGTSASSGSDGPDVLDGGPGADAVAYTFRDVGVTVDLRRTDGQGEAGENDTFTSVEGASDGNGDDLLIGSAVANLFRVGNGTDRIEVRDGGVDTVYCNIPSGPDVVVADALDVVAGCATVDRSPPIAPSDADGDGVADAADRCPAVAGPAVAGGCPTAAPPPAVPRPGAPPALAAPRATSTTLRADRRRRLVVRLAAAPATESVAVTLTRGRRTLASGTVRATNGAPAVARLRLSVSAYRSLRRARKLSASLTLSAGGRTRAVGVTLRA